MHKLLLAVLALTLSGCAGFVGEVTTASPESLREFDSTRLAEAYGSDWKFWGKKNAAIRAELTDRNVFDAAEWKLIDEREIQERCRQDVVLASWGPPTKREVTVLDSVRMETWRYGEFGFGAVNLVYIANGRVAGWSELK